MYRFNKASRDVRVNCKVCKKEITFKLPEDVVKRATDFPTTFRYIHGDPIHSLTLYIDRHENIRGVEFAEALEISPDVIDTFSNTFVSEDSESKVLIRTLISAFTTVMNVYSEDSSNMLHSVGEVFGETYEKLFNGIDELDLLQDIEDFWKRNNLGKINSISKSNTRVMFNIDDNFECSHLPNVGRTMCKFNEGFFQSIFSLKFGGRYKAEETRCLANGDPTCTFKIWLLED